jgi:hypothetical protein
MWRSHGSIREGRGFILANGLDRAAKGAVALPGLTAFGGARPADIFGLLALGNFSVYLDVAWQTKAYETGGIAEMQRLLPKGTALRAWEKIDEGQKVRAKQPAKALELFQEAGKLFAENEQLEVLQPILDANLDLARKLTPLLKVTPPAFPGAGFLLTNFPDGKARLKDINDITLPSFLIYEHEHKAAVDAKMKAVIDKGK